MEIYDAGLFRQVNHGPESWTGVMVWLSTAFDNRTVLYAFVGMVVCLIVLPKTRRAAIESLIAFPIANSVTDLFKHFLPEPRPFQVLSDAILRVGWSESMGTASAHSANMAAVAFVMTYRLRYGGAIWIALATLVGYSRVFTGAHFPHQVALGWLCGGLVGYLTVSISNLITDRRRPAQGLIESGETSAPSLTTDNG